MGKVKNCWHRQHRRKNCLGKDDDLRRGHLLSSGAPELGQKSADLKGWGGHGLTLFRVQLVSALLTGLAVLACWRSVPF